MTEFITRNYGQKEFEVIIKTDSKEHYKATEDFARRLIDHVKPQTNADRIRAMSDRELAEFMAERNVNESTLLLLNKDHGLTATQIKVMKHNVYCALMQWLQQPAEGD